MKTVTKLRKRCLNCEQYFESEGRHNRLCSSCQKRTNSSFSETETVTVGAAYDSESYTLPLDIINTRQAM